MMAYRDEKVIEAITEEDVPDEWIDRQYQDCGRNNYDCLVGSIKKYWEDRHTKRPYPEHGIPHCEAVERNIRKLATLFKISLDKRERFVLSAAAYLHDTSMREGHEGNTDESNPHKFHHIESANWLMDNHRSLTLTESYASVIAIIIKFHRRKEDLNECPVKGILDEQYVRPRLLSAIFRLADALHVDSTRVNEEKYLYMRHGAYIPVDTRFHWIKSFLAPEILVSAQDKAVDILLNIPDFVYEGDDPPGEMIERVEFLANSICQMLQEEVDSVNPVLSKYADFLISEVRYIVNRIPDRRKDRIEPYRRFIMDYSTRHYSPTASMALETALSNIIQSTERFDGRALPRGEDYVKTLGDLIETTTGFLREFLKVRSCHLGLKNMLRIVETIGAAILAKVDGDSEESKEFARRAMVQIHKITKAIREERKNTRELIVKCFEDLVTREFFADGSGPVRIALFGNSSLIKTCLKDLPPDKKELTELYICECRGKTLYASNNRVIYSDALAYALDLKQLGFDKIHVIPDIALARIVGCGEDSVDILLVGTNGIGLSGECAHTIGHLAVTKLCEPESTSIVLVSDSFKIGKFERNVDAKREGWYTSDMNLLRDIGANQIDVFCPREDVIHLSDIDFLVNEEKPAFEPKKNQELIGEKLVELYSKTMEIIGENVSNSQLGEIIGEQPLDELVSRIKEVPKDFSQ